MQIPKRKWMQVGSGWERDADSRRKVIQVPDGKGYRFQHRKHQRVPVFSATVKDQGISLLGVFHTESCRMLYKCSFFWRKKFAKEERPRHIPPGPLPHQSLSSLPTSGALVLLAQECEK
jgi:hypothetical protein